MLIDTHCHLDWNSFDPDRDEVIRRAVEAGVTRLVTIGVDVPSSRRALDLAEKHEAVYAAVGVHPNDCAGFDANTLKEIGALAHHPKVVAIGEIGLDYYWHTVDHDTQARAFQAQLELAADLHKPVIVHSRAAAPDVLTILEQYFTHHLSRDTASSLSETKMLPSIPAAKRPRGVGLVTGTLHSYFDDLSICQRAFAIGFFVGVTGPITFKKSGREREIVKQLPLERVLIETDAPFLTPAPHRGKRNEPAYVRYVAETIATVRGVAAAEVARQTTDNAERLFGWV